MPKDDVLDSLLPQLLAQECTVALNQLNIFAQLILKYDSNNLCELEIPQPIEEFLQHLVGTWTPHSGRDFSDQLRMNMWLPRAKSVCVPPKVFYAALFYEFHFH